MTSEDLSRRTFLATSAATLAAMSLRTVSAQTTAPEGPRKLGFALVGVGSLTMGQLLPAFAKCQFARPTALVSGHPDKARHQAEKYGIDPKNIYNYGNFDSIKENPEIDVVYVVLPNGMHAEYTIRAAKAGKHVLCEKPMANTVEECEAMIAACAEAKKKLMIAYRMRYEPMTQKAIQLAQSADDIGTIMYISGEAGFSIGDPRQWRLNKKLAGGGPMMDMGVYPLNAIRYLSGQEPVEVMAYESTNRNDPRFKEVEETLVFQMRFASGMLATVETSYGFHSGHVRVYGTKRILELEPFQSYWGNHAWVIEHGHRVEVAYTPVNQFAAEMDHFAQCIMEGKEPLTPGEEGLRDIRIAMAAYRSAAEGRPVKIG